MAIAPPERPLTDGVVALRPLADDDLPGMQELVDDPEARRFTRLPDAPSPGFAAQWLARYVGGWTRGTLAGFAIDRAATTATTAATGPTWLGWAGIVAYDEPAAEAELGYMVAPAARGHGVARRALALLTEWAFQGAGVQRAELVIDVANRPSLAIAQRAGYRREGVRRNASVKPGTRADVEIWSRLPGDPPPP